MMMGDDGSKDLSLLSTSDDALALRRSGIEVLLVDGSTPHTADAVSDKQLQVFHVTGVQRAGVHSEEIK